VPQLGQKWTPGDRAMLHDGHDPALSVTLTCLAWLGIGCGGTSAIYAESCAGDTVTT
jgi:hypothetical protein